MTSVGPRAWPGHVHTQVYTQVYTHASVLWLSTYASIGKNWTRVLAFMCDPLYLGLIENASEHVKGGARILQLGKGNMNTQARQALKELSTDEDHYHLLLADFFNFVAVPHEVLVVLPFHAWWVQ